MTRVTEKQECRVCGTRFSGRVLLNFGEQAIVDFLRPGEVGRGKAPLQLVYCTICGLVQLRHTVDADTLFKKFWYRSSVNEQMRMALTDVVWCAEKYAKLMEGDAVCDIGSNDGSLLFNYPIRGILKVGFEPAEELAAESMGHFRNRKDESWEIVPGYFNAIEALACSRRNLYKIVTACAMFYDLDKPEEFLDEVKAVLHPEGVFIIQMNYLGLMIKNLAFDNVGHEHLCYYSLTTLKTLLERVGLGVVNAELNDVNGGSIRVYAMHKELAKIKANRSVIQDMLMLESTQISEGAIKNFADRADATAKILLGFLKELKAAGKKVYAYGASTRGMTLLQTIFREEKATDYLIAVAERDEKKYKKRMAGLDLPIVPEVEARKEADYMLVLPYHFWKSIRDREREWMLKGGRLILPLPYPKVMGYAGDGPIGMIPIAYDLEEIASEIKA